MKPGRDGRPASASERIGVTTPPEIPENLPEVVVASVDALEDLSDAKVTGAVLTAVRAQRLLIARVRLTKADFTESHLLQLHADDTIFDRCNFSNVKIPDAAFTRVEFLQNKLSGIQAKNAKFTDVAFRECRLDFSSFTDAVFREVTFENCQMHECDFSVVRFDRVQFIGCDFSRATFNRMKVTRSEMRRCTLKGIRGLSELRGIAMEWTDILDHADVLAAELGITVASPSTGEY